MKTAFAATMHALANTCEQAEEERHEATRQRREAEKRRQEAENERNKQRKHTAARRHADVLQFRSAIDSEMKESRADFQRGHEFFMQRGTTTNTAPRKPARHGRKSHAGKA